MLMFYWFEPVLYLDPVSKFPETTERPGYFAGFSDHVGDALTLKILKMIWSQSYIELWLDQQQMPVIRIKVSFQSDVQESLKLLDTKPSLTFVWKDSHHKHKSRKTYDDVSNRIRSKADYTDPHIVSRTRSKIHGLNVNNVNIQTSSFLCMMQLYFKNMECLKHKICN
jgi:hypothetical protein